ncbi:MAG: monovalent cation/H(+) antiporter subunit G [Serpentinimonas sp.]|jgi:multicomponent Na+:H+ antiporter subunit G|nr:monovalent cation/H(+) antiporter subunit G [Serpentinimonas sp.]
MMTELLSPLAALLLVAGGALLLLAAWGVIMLPDALARQHAATKAGTLSLAMVCVGGMLAMQDSGWTWRLGLILVFLLGTLPVASHLLARAAVREAGHEAALARAPLLGDDPAA